MDLQLVERENTLLGQDFLTWLWHASESRNGLFQAKDGRDFGLRVEQRVSVQGGEGQSLETASVSSPRGLLSEAMTGLGTGKKVCRAQLKIEMDQEAWLVQVNAADFGLSGLKTPKVEARPGEGEDPDALFLEKAHLVLTCLEALDEVYALFLGLRLGTGWPTEARAVRDWISGNRRPA
ncbi:MAG: hypothetical protein PHV85_05760 [Desulfovibrionaceae bacterium]|nr:hypothetical protein [Desulfovibrionaceae bacterium]